jgi:hypothetical protein
VIKTKLFFETFVLLVVVALVNQIATEKFLYWKINEFDSLVHFLGGAFVALFFLWLYFFSGFFNPNKRRFRDFLLVSMLGVALVSVVWEIYEIFIGEVIFSGPAYPFDTTLDFIMDTLGGLSACFYAYLRAGTYYPKKELQETDDQNN